MGSGAWPFVVGEVICLVYSDNERDSGLLTSVTSFYVIDSLLKGTSAFEAREKEQ